MTACLTPLRNPKLLSKLPHGFTLAATTQTAGRGRGANVWIAPPGTLIFSTIINHPAHLTMSRPIIFIQYITAIAIVEAIQSYGKGYEKLPIKIKWPNDICKSLPTNRGRKQKEMLMAARRFGSVSGRLWRVCQDLWLYDPMLLL